MTAASMAEDPDNLDLIHLNLGRSYFGAGNFPRAIEYYARVRRKSPHWLEAQFERSWAHFRVEDVTGSIGLLLTHLSPWFESTYMPEAHLLQTYSLFLLCKFPSANQEIEAFRSKYLAVNAQLEASLMRSDDASIFEQTRGLIQGNRTDVPAQMLVPYLTEARFLKAVSAVAKAEEEIGRLRNVSANPFSEVVMEWVSARRVELIKSEGARIKAYLQGQANSLNTMLSDTEIARLDILRLETQLYEQAAELGKMADAARLAQRKLRVTRDQQSWPFQGEFWADELGYFRVTATPQCPQNLMVGTQQN
jgi:tetratricopeptide (TPR) repeat protein